MLVRRFDLIRLIDETGISGTGRVATGIRVGPWAFMRWLTPQWTVTWYPKWEWIYILHGHGGKTQLVWKDGKP